jgi:succinate dehydrogenase / fumarate reductase, iron-sulfur subunit
MAKKDEIDEYSKIINIERLDNSTGKFKTSVFNLKAYPSMTVLDALLQIKETKDATLSMRYSCRMGTCGSCGMVIDGKPSLACRTLVASFEKTVSVGPMLGHPVLKDLVNDFDDFFHKHKSIMPWIIPTRKDEKFNSETTTKQTAENVEKLIPFSSCIKCGLCLDACPVVNTNPFFVGPQALAQVHRLALDSRDHGSKKRAEAVETKEGIWGCEFVGACSTVCPKGVDPALAIQELKIESMKNELKLDRKKK